MRDAATGAYSLAWWGKGARTYFVQHSDDLVTWTYWPIIESGAAAVTEYGFTNTNPRGFFRLRFSDAATGGNPEAADFDGDHVGNMTELNQSTDPLGWTDVDGDLVPGDWEVFHGFNPTNAADAVLDADGDGLTNRAEFNHNTNPHLADTDADGFADGYEVGRGTDPALASSSPLISAQGQIAVVTALAQAYVNVRAADGSLEQRAAAWAALQAAKGALDAELLQHLENTSSPEIQAALTAAQGGSDSGAAPAYGLPSTAILQYRWGNASYTGDHWMSYISQWVWSTASQTWSYMGLYETLEGDENNSGYWHNSDFQSAPVTSVEATINVTFSPQQWRDVGLEPLSATGTYEVGTGTGTVPVEPGYPGTSDGQTAFTSDVQISPVTYTRQWREYRLKRSEDGDQGVPLFMNFVSSDATHEAFGETLSLPGGANESSETITCEAKPTVPNVGAGATKKAIEIRPDDTLYDPASGIGHIGDVVPPAKSDSTQKHFVTPKASVDLSDSYVTFQATGVTAEDFVTTPPLEPRLSWLGGIAVPGDVTKRKVSRHLADQTILRLKSKDGGTDVVMNVWVIHAKVVSNTTVSSSDTGLEDVGGGFVRIKTARNQVLFEVEPIEICQGLTTGAEIPDLSGKSSTLPPGVTKNTRGDTQMKWDVSQRVKAVVRDSRPSLVATDYQGEALISAALTAKAASFPHARVELIEYPASAVESNDDAGPRGEGLDPLEEYNPYSNAEQLGPGAGGLFPAVGQLVTTDKPTPPKVREAAKHWGQTIDWRNQFDSFVRVEIGSKWYRISFATDTPNGLWQTKKAFIGNFLSGWSDNGSGIIPDNSGW